jgi:hypothetical protein
MRDLLNNYFERKRRARFEKRMILAVIFVVVVGFILTAGCL